MRFRNCPHLKKVGSRLPDHCVFAYGLHLTEDDFYNKHSFFPSNDFLTSDLIIDDMLSALEGYYGTVGDYDSISCGGGPAFCRKIKGRGSQRSLGKLRMGDIFTTGPPTGRCG